MSEANEFAALVRLSAHEGATLGDCARWRDALEKIASTSMCACWEDRPIGAVPKWIGCDLHHSDDPNEYCLWCIAHEALQTT